MEASTILFHQPPRITAASGISDARSYFATTTACTSSRSSFSGVSIKGQNFRESRVRLGAKEGFGLEWSLDFVDKGHVDYYKRDGYVWCGEKKEKKRVKVSSKKKLKFLEGFSRDLNMFAKMDFAGEAQDSVIEEAAEALMKKLQQLRMEKELLMEEKANMKASKMKCLDYSESSSSSSSESSDSECRDLINMRNRITEAITVETEQPTPSQNELQLVSQEEATLKLLVMPSQELDRMLRDSIEDQKFDPNGVACVRTSTSYSNEVSKLESKVSSEKRIEVCMGKKCQKGGGAALLDKFTRAVGGNGTVVGCKCMRKCRDGPNVRVCNEVDNGVDDSVRTPLNPLFIGVGLEDVELIVSRFLGEDIEESGLVPCKLE